MQADRIAFPYEVWLNGQYLNSYASENVAVAKAELIAGASVYQWVEARWCRWPVYIGR